MERVRFTRVNDSNTYLNCSEAASRELSEHLTFWVPGYQFMPKYKSKVWDGKIRLYSEWSPYIQTGLVPRAIQFFKKNGYSVELDQGVAESFLDSSISEGDLLEWIESQTIYDNSGDEIVPFDHQFEAVLAMLKHKRLTLLSPTSSGKSLIIYLTTKWRLEADRKGVLIVVPTQQLVEQMANDISCYSAGTMDTHKVYSGKDKFSDTRVIISTWQSIYKLDNAFFDQFGTVILDEGHLAQGKCIGQLIEKCSNCGYRYALTGTLDGSKSHQFVVEGAFGPVKKFTTTRELMDKGIAAMLSIKNVLFNYDEDLVDEFWSSTKGKYDAELKFTWRLKERNRKIAKMVSRLSGNTLILFSHKKHGEEIWPHIEDECLAAGKTHLFKKTGDDPLQERMEVSKLMDQVDNAVFGATFGILSTGVSIKKIDHLVFITTVKSRIRTLQSIGRSLRVNATKKSAILWEIIDNFSTKGKGGTMKLNHSLKHYLIRCQMYQDEQFDSKTIEIPIEKESSK